MKKIVLLCAAGMSTSILVSKMREFNQEHDYNYQVDAYAVAEADQVCPDADIILLGPQVRYELRRIKGMFPDKIVESIDMAAYGLMDGVKVMRQVMTYLGDC